MRLVSCMLRRGAMVSWRKAASGPANPAREMNCAQPWMLIRQMSDTVAHASKSHVRALGLTWDDVSGKNNAHYAPFNWRSA
jgi:hypothetical protein